MSEPASVVLPAGTAAVLRALAGVETAFTIRHVARVAGVSPNRAHQVILRLAEHGLVLIDDLGGSRRCRLNREHLAAPAVINLVRLRAAMIELLQRQFSEWSVLPDQASLFGSAARGDGDTTSDLDILVVRPTDRDEDDPVWRNQLFESGARIRTATGNHVAWFDISRAELFQASQQGESLVDEWRRDAVRLVGPDLRSLLREPS
jgi:DNA-binding transcriptional ArsR family regulator